MGAAHVHLWHGEDEYAIDAEIKKLQKELGDSSLAEMNTVRLDGRSSSLDEWETAFYTLPFMTAQRMVILTNPLARLTSPAAQERFKKLAAKVPPAVRLVLVEYKTLTEKRERDRGHYHWLEKWGMEGSEGIDLKNFPPPYPDRMPERIRQIAKEMGAQIEPEAAVLLATLVGSEPRIADQELKKLHAYVNYQRAIALTDVELVVADQGHGNIFNLVDAIGEKNGRKAADLLHRLLEVQETITIFGMVVRQFRLLIQAREVMEGGGNAGEIARQVRLHPAVAEKVLRQARRFSLPQLEAIYRRLSELDEQMKTGGMAGELALETFVAEVTGFSLK